MVLLVAVVFVGCRHEEKQARDWAKRSFARSLQGLATRDESEMREGNLEAKAYKIRRYRDTLSFFGQERKLDALYVVYSEVVFREADNVGLIGFEWLEPRDRVRGAVLYVQDATGDFHSHRLPVFSQDPRAIKIPTAPPGQRLASFFSAFLALTYSACEGIRLEEPPLELKALTGVKVVLPDEVRGRNLEIAVYDADGRESNRVRVFCYESFRNWAEK